MNYLAHTLLSKKNIDYQIANLAADVIKGRPWENCRPAHAEALNMHKAIDSFTDRHPHVSRAKARLGRGYLKGVVLDITFDHFVYKHWNYYVNIDFEDFVSTFYLYAHHVIDDLPPKIQEFIKRTIHHDFLRQYQSFSSLQQVFERFNQRLSANILAKESATDYFPLLRHHYHDIENDFLLFFPELIKLFLEKSQAQANEHYFITKYNEAIEQYHTHL